MGGIWSNSNTIWVSLVHLLGHESTVENLIVWSFIESSVLSGKSNNEYNESDGSRNER